MRKSKVITLLVLKFVQFLNTIKCYVRKIKTEQKLISSNSS